MTSSSLPARLQSWWPLCEEAGNRWGVDPLLLLAIIDRESLGGVSLKPPGPAGTGDGGHGKGLMQIDDRYHQGFTDQLLPDGSPAWADPARNIEFGTRLLTHNLEVFDGDEWFACASYNAGIDRVQRALLSISQPVTEYKRRASADSVTTHSNYSSDVFGRRDRFRVLLSQVAEEPPND